MKIEESPNANVPLHIPIGYHEYISRLVQSDRPDHYIKSDWVLVEYILLFVSMIFVGQIRTFHKKENGYVPLSNKSACDYVANAEVLLNWLVNHGILQRKGYSTGAHPYLYRFKELHRFEAFYPKWQVIIRKLKKERIALQSHAQSHPILSKLLQKAKGVTLEPGAEEWVEANSETLHKRACALHNIAGIRSMDPGYLYFITQGGKGERVYTSHASLWKKVRKRFLRIDGEPYEELDIKCSQFQMMYLLFKDRFKEDPIVRPLFEIELENYAACFKQEGGLYTFIGDQLGWTREYAKDKMLAWLFDPKGYRIKKIYPEINKVFKENFPRLFFLVLEFKKKGSLAAALQKIESEIVIEDIAIRQLYAEPFSYVTIHDSILFPESLKAKIESEVWEPTLRRYGLPQYLPEKSKMLLCEGSNSVRVFGVSFPFPLSSTICPDPEISGRERPDLPQLKILNPDILFYSGGPNLQPELKTIPE